MTGFHRCIRTDSISETKSNQVDSVDAQLPIESVALVPAGKKKYLWSAGESKKNKIPSNWVSYSEAVEAASNEFVFVYTEEDPFFGDEVDFEQRGCCKDEI